MQPCDGCVARQAPLSVGEQPGPTPPTGNGTYGSGSEETDDVKLFRQVKTQRPFCAHFEKPLV